MELQGAEDAVLTILVDGEFSSGRTSRRQIDVPREISLVVDFSTPEKPCVSVASQGEGGAVSVDGRLEVDRALLLASSAGASP